ncbi:MAG: cytochrome C [Chloroflexi bacterium HGW-Chloroflexi-10]|nr:MAG: cytochrome C [Chloroflexi bacterium HGW-Chloroflexi-10]
MKPQIPWWQRPGIRISGGLVLLILLGGAVTGIYFTQIPPEQPIPFPHNFHVGVGADCTYCHTGAATGPSAGLPSTNKCWGCHEQIEPRNDNLKLVASYGSEGKPIPWVPVAIMPEFVMFNHRPHVTAGVTCETCHGDVAKMTTAEPQNGMNMGWCLDCHKKSSTPEDFVRLSDCATCHY